MNAREWTDDFAAQIGVEPPTAEEIKRILDLAALAAHSSERIAAPIACWLGGRSGAALEELQAAAARIGGASDASDST